MFTTPAKSSMSWDDDAQHPGRVACSVVAVWGEDSAR